jgi:DNA-binding CsgD family transcriptional regulator
MSFASRGIRKKDAKHDGAIPSKAETEGYTRRVDLVVTECERKPTRGGRTERSWRVPIAVLEADRDDPKDPLGDAQSTLLHTLEQFLSVARPNGSEPPRPAVVESPVPKTLMALDTLSPDCRLTPREKQVLEHVLAGHPNKETAEKLMISRRTVEHHRAAVMQKTGARSVPELMRIVAGVGSTRS